MDADNKTHQCCLPGGPPARIAGFRRQIWTHIRPAIPASSRPATEILPLWGDLDKGGCPYRSQTGLTSTTGHIILVILARRFVMQKMAAAQFKAQCLAVMDQVSQSGRAVVITKHGKAVVKLVPANEGEDEIFGALAG